ncbi:MAG: hypothetical protein ACRCSN_14545 [Dermatophilaceae bacterium]
MSALAMVPIKQLESVRSGTLHLIKQKFDDTVVRFDAWFLVFVAVILGLGATLIAGMAVWCVIYRRLTFTGNWEFRDFGLRVYFECR